MVQSGCPQSEHGVRASPSSLRPAASLALTHRGLFLLTWQSWAAQAGICHPAEAGTAYPRASQSPAGGKST